jgi:DNA-binding transcriptional ArsR family regulator
MRSKAPLFADDLADLAAQARALAHPARLDILRVLAARQSCVCGEIVDELPLAQATVSQHLKALKEAGLIQGEVDGPRVCYCLDREALVALRDALAAFFTGLDLDAPPSCC